MKVSSCAKCPVTKMKKYCLTDSGKYPADCPTVTYKNDSDAVKEMLEEGGDLDFYLNSLNFVGSKVTRIEETVNFARSMGYKKLGLAFCMSVRNEAKILSSIFEKAGFEVVSAICKVGGSRQDDFVENETKSKAVVCNPVLQAKVLNDAEVEYNIVFGLCVGHDSLFMKYADAMSTVLVAKDRVLGHNPMAAIYTIDSFYGDLKKLDPKK